ncbi:MAG TPA: DUF1572 family protein [Gemmatimonadaceae bacterium]|nr:DUF1572 family protein [Gemmatimonadaceae bacterium]
MSSPDSGAAEILGRAYLADLAARFSTLRDVAERAIAQVDDGALHDALDAESNSIAVLMAHVGGNLASRFTDFLTTDGEKPDRDRDGEFDLPGTESRARLEARWSAGWRALEWSLATLEPADLLRTVTIRGEPLTVFQALSRALAHVAQHVGQIVLLAKHAAGPRWRTLSLPRAARGGEQA